MHGAGADGKARALRWMNTSQKNYTGGDTVLKNLLTTKCPKCGTQINGSHLKPPFLKPISNLDGFYGNRVKKFMKAVCDCGEEFIAYLTPASNGYKIIDLAYANKPESQDEPDISKLDRKELIALAKDLGIEGKLATMKTVDLIAAIQEAKANAESAGKET